jgi:hypothetical protein
MAAKLMTDCCPSTPKFKCSACVGHDIEINAPDTPPAHERPHPVRGYYQSETVIILR